MNLDNNGAALAKEAVTPSGVFQTALNNLITLTLKEQNEFLRAAKEIVLRDREAQLARYREEIQQLEKRCEEMVLYQQELAGI